MIKLDTYNKISCPIFQAKEELVLRDIIQEANGSFTEEDKCFKLQELEEELGFLLACSSYSSSFSQCRVCRAVCRLYKEKISSYFNKL